MVPDGQDVSIVTLDVSRFDKLIPGKILHTVFDIMDAYYSYDEEEASFRRNLRNNIIHSVHICGPIGYQLHWGNPSGNTLTTIINTLTNMLYLRTALIRLGHPHARIAVYGDDSCIALPPKTLTTKEFIDYFQKHGIKTTPGEKYGNTPSASDYFTLLGRQCRVKDGCASMVLPLTRILDMLNYGEPGINPTGTLQAKVDAFAAELYDHGPTTYAIYRKRVLDVQHPGIHMITYEEQAVQQSQFFRRDGIRAYFYEDPDSMYGTNGLYSQESFRTFRDPTLDPNAGPHSDDESDSEYSSPNSDNALGSD